jgi:hypothetical protein
MFKDININNSMNLQKPMKSLLTLGTQNDHADSNMASLKTKANRTKQY